MQALAHDFSVPKRFNITKQDWARVHPDFVFLRLFDEMSYRTAEEELRRRQSCGGEEKQPAKISKDTHSTL